MKEDRYVIQLLISKGLESTMLTVKPLRLEMVKKACSAIPLFTLVKIS